MLEQPQPKAGTKSSSPTTQTNVLTMKLYGKQHVRLYSGLKNKSSTSAKLSAKTYLSLSNESSTLANRTGEMPEI